MELVASLDYLSITRLFTYYGIIAAFLLLTLAIFGIDKLKLYIVLVFWEGLFAFLGKMGLIDFGIYKIALFIFLFIISFNNILRARHYDRTINLFFLLFLAIYWLSVFVNNQPLLTSASQFATKFAVPFLFYHTIKWYNIESDTSKLLKMIMFIVYLQVLFSVLKIALMGGVTEAIVGSLAYTGGGGSCCITVVSFSLPISSQQSSYLKMEVGWCGFFLHYRTS